MSVAALHRHGETGVLRRCDTQTRQLQMQGAKRLTWWNEVHVRLRRGQGARSRGQR